MARAFIHKYELTISNHPDLLKKTQDQPTAQGAPSAVKPQKASNVVVGSAGSSDYKTVTSESLTFSELQIQAGITYSTTAAAQKAEFKIYNLSADNLNRITTQSTVILKAGYATDQVLPIIFVGQVNNVSSSKTGPDNITVLRCTDGAKALRETNYKVTYPKGKTYQFILDDVLAKINSVGVPLGEFQSSERTSKVIPRAVSYNTNLPAILEELGKTLGYRIYQNLGSINLIPDDSDDRQTVVDVFARNVKGTVSATDDKSGKTTTSPSARPAGVKFTTFLNGNIVVGAKVNMKEGKSEGTYLASSVTHKLDFRGSAWDTEVSCEGTK